MRAKAKFQVGDAVWYAEPGYAPEEATITAVRDLLAGEPTASWYYTLDVTDGANDPRKTGDYFLWRRPDQRAELVEELRMRALLMNTCADELEAEARETDQSTLKQEN